MYGVIAASFLVCKCSHVHRSGNTVALVARQMPPDGRSVVFSDHFHPGLVHIVARDL